VEELHLGDGEVLTPGEILIQNGRIVEVGQRVSHPSGAKIVSGFAAMPGAIDALGYLGMEGQNPRISKSFAMGRMVEPGDRIDREVALAGTTTVNMTAMSQPEQTTTMTYKPAGLDVERMVVRERGSLLLGWPSGATASLIQKEKEYSESWKEYGQKMKEWQNKPKEEAAEKEEKKDEADESTEESKEDSKEDSKKKKKSKKRPEAIAVTGTFEGELTLGGDTAEKARLRILEGEDGSLQGTLRTADYPDLIYLEGTRDGYDVVLDAQTTEGGLRLGLELQFTDNDEDLPYLEGQRLFRGELHDFSLPRTNTDYPVAKRPVGDEEEEKDDKDEKGKPSPPSEDPLLEMLRGSRNNKASIFVKVDREDHIRSCVDAFAAAGIKPVLVSASEIGSVIPHVRGKIAGVVLTGSPISTVHGGLVTHNRYAALQAAGIPVAFASFAEEGAAGLVDVATYAASDGWSSEGALRALTADAAHILSLSNSIGTLATGRSADVLLLDGPPLVPSTRILNVWVNGREVQR
jgi:imidazolonepropionase-like amidohydrolase